MVLVPWLYSTSYYWIWYYTDIFFIFQRKFLQKSFDLCQFLDNWLMCNTQVNLLTDNFGWKYQVQSEVDCFFIFLWRLNWKLVIFHDFHTCPLWLYSSNIVWKLDITYISIIFTVALLTFSSFILFVAKFNVQIHLIQSYQCAKLLIWLTFLKCKFQAIWGLFQNNVVSCQFI